MKTQIELTAEEYVLLTHALAVAIALVPTIQDTHGAGKALMSKLHDGTEHCKPGRSTFTITIETKEDE